MDFETTKNVNPFLMDDATEYGGGNQNGGASSNPFLNSDFSAEPSGACDNPFLTSSYNENASLPDTNPFAFGSDYGDATNLYQNQQESWQQPAQNYGSIPPMDFGVSQEPVQVAQKPLLNEPETRPSDLDLAPKITSINDPENDLLLSSDEEVSKPKRPPPPHPTIPKETKDLILNVTDALKATSDHLLDRLPPTRAPSPTAFPDFSALSPTPDTFTDLLGNVTSEPPQTNLPQFPSNDDLNILTKPEKPPPPRPPPARPAPPKPAPPAQVPKPQPQPQNEDIFDLFGTSKPPPPKTKDAILNLYSQPKPPPKDLLTDDLDVSVPAATLMENEVKQENQTLNLLTSEVKPAQEIPDSSQILSEPLEKSEPATAAPVVDSSNIQSENQPFEISEEPLVQKPVEVAEVQKPVESEKKLSLTPNEEVPYLFGTGPPDTTAAFENDTAAPEVPIFGTTKPEVASFGTTQPDVPSFGTTEPEVPIFGTTKQEVSSFNATEPEVPIFGTTTKPEVSSYGTAQPGVPIFGTTQPDVPIFGTAQPEVPIFGTTKPEERTNLVPEIETKSSVLSSEPISGGPKAPLDAFDAFAAKFESTGMGPTASGDMFDPFSGSAKPAEADAWGSTQNTDSSQQGFGTDDTFDAFLSMSKPPPTAPRGTHNKLNKVESADSDDAGFNVFIKPKEGESYMPGLGGAAPVLAPPPKPAVGNSIFGDEPRFNPFDKGEFAAFTQEGVQLPPLSQTEPYEGGFKKSDSQETPPTPLFDEDVSQPLEDFPRIHYAGEGWEMHLRQPNKKKITGQRFWKKIFVKLVYQGDNPVLQLFNLKEDKDPFQELPLQACYSVSDISAQQYDQFGKIFTVKLQYIFYKERPGVRPGQVTKAERITNKLSQFAAYAIQGDYQGVKEFGSDLKKLGLPVEHAPQISQLLKLGSMTYEDLKQFSVTLEECLFRMPVHRDRALNYKMEEVQITVVDEIYVEQDASGHVDKQIARVRLFFLGFLSGMPDVELGVNDMWRQGKEVVGRHDIIPVVTEEWIRLEAVEFHSCIQQEEYEKTRTIKFKPPDACYIELMRFRIRPPRNRELPLQLKAVMCITGSKVELRADVLVPGFASRKLGQIPCEDVMIRFPIPECWIYLFRVEKHFRYGSVKSAHRRTGKIKGIERFLGAVDTLEPSLLEVTSGQAKYEHQHRAIVWRMPRLPKEGQGAYTTHNLVCRMQLTSFDQIPDNLAEYAYVEFTMPATQASHTTVRSVSLVDSPSDNPPEKYVRQLARHEYRVGIEHVHQEETAAYEAATMIKPKAVPETVPETPVPAAAPESDSDSSD